MSQNESERERQAESRNNKFFRDDTRFALGRIAVFQYVTVGVFLFLLAGFWVLQVRDHEAISEMAERNRIKTVPLLAPRGKILDRDGRIIVDNNPSFNVVLDQENLKPEHLDAIAEGLRVDPQELRARVARYALRPKYVPVPVKQELTPAEIAFVESHRDLETFPELELLEAQRRLYPRDGLAAHAIGYVGEVSEQELNTTEFAKFSQGDVVGKAGLERQYNDTLIGIDGQKRVVVDSSGRERDKLEEKEAIPGKALQLTLDLDLQAVAELAMDGKRGAVVALDPRSGEILAMVSRPTFDPNAFTGRIKTQDWKDLIENPYNPLLNRAIQAQFAPGSTFKPIVAIAGLESGTIDDSFHANCTGGATFGDHYFKCHAQHGFIQLHEAISHSCDVFFYEAGNRIGIDNIAQYAQLAGFGKKTGVDLPGEAEGLMPTPRWKIRIQHDKWQVGETVNVSIGQGAVTVTPMQLASAIGGLAEGGVWYKPHLTKDAQAAEPRHADFNAANVAKIVSGMYGVVNEPGGTGTSGAIPGLTVCGKTGTAQRLSNELAKSNKALREQLKDNAWFVGFAPRENPEIVVVALFEGGELSTLAAPIARDVIKAYFDKKARTAHAGDRPSAFFKGPHIEPPEAPVAMALMGPAEN
jgi:penicillin-binding protein 2